jgi:hypothetical protein
MCHGHSSLVVMKNTDVLAYFSNDRQDPLLDPRVSQLALAKDGCTMMKRCFTVAKHIHAAAIPSLHDDFKFIWLYRLTSKCFFSSLNRQLVMDMLAGIASRDYFDLRINKGGNMLSFHPRQASSVGKFPRGFVTELPHGRGCSDPRTPSLPLCPCC